VPLEFVEPPQWTRLLRLNPKYQLPTGKENGHGTGEFAIPGRVQLQRGQWTNDSRYRSPNPTPCLSCGTSADRRSSHLQQFERSNFGYWRGVLRDYMPNPRCEICWITPRSRVGQKAQRRRVSSSIHKLQKRLSREESPTNPRRPFTCTKQTCWYLGGHRGEDYREKIDPHSDFHPVSCAGSRSGRSLQQESVFFDHPHQ